MTEVLLGTVAIEPNRWGTIRPDRSPSTRLSDWLDRIAALPVDGIEVWEGHLMGVDAAEREQVLTGPVPVRIHNSYVGFDDAGDEARRAVAAVVAESGARAVKFNVGNDPDAEGAYAERLAAWLELLPADVAIICECHAGISIAEDPTVAARVLEAAGPPERVQALVHTHDDADLLAAKFDALGERITHVHVNHLDLTTFTHPTLAEVEERLAATVAILRGRGFAGSWTLEFVSGVLTDDDHPAALLDAAAADLAVLTHTLEAT
jgi:sugar phosphate isomerase/epimerase